MEGDTILILGICHRKDIYERMEWRLQQHPPGHGTLGNMEPDSGLQIGPFRQSDNGASTLSAAGPAQRVQSSGCWRALTLRWSSYTNRPSMPKGWHSGSNSVTIANSRHS